MPDWPQTWQWNWIEKVAAKRDIDGCRWLSIVANGQAQGLAQLDLRKTCRDPGQFGEPLIYVQYLEVAPWNWRVPGGIPRILGVGTAR